VRRAARARALALAPLPLSLFSSSRSQFQTLPPTPTNNQTKTKNRFRQAFGLAVGVLWGYLPWTGFVAFLSFVAANVVAASALQGHLGLDDDHPAVAGGELVSEGMPGSLSLFLVAWTLAYTAFHGSAAGAASAAAA
jgi:hypothetical protein